MFDDVEGGALGGFLELPGVGYTVIGGGDLAAMSIAIRFTNTAKVVLAERFGCAPTTEAVKNAIVAGLAEMFGHDAVTCRHWHEGDRE